MKGPTRERGGAGTQVNPRPLWVRCCGGKYREKMQIQKMTRKCRIRKAMVKQNVTVK